MDKIDKKIVFELQKNGRLSNFEIAEKVGLSPSPCLRRIKNLEKKKLYQVILQLLTKNYLDILSQHLYQ